MTPEQFRTIGEALRGPQWQRALAADLDRDERTIRYYMTGERPIPRTVVLKLVELLGARRATLQTLWADTLAQTIAK